MSEAWYEVAGAESPLTQGDLIFDCPLLLWDNAAGATLAEGTISQAFARFFMRVGLPQPVAPAW
jgi:hypothetical protein